jgi:hypothetical protein
MIDSYKKILKYLLNIDNFNNFKNNYNKANSELQKQKKIGYKNKRILAVYDFIDMPYTYDISNFLLNSEIERRRLNLEKIDLLLVANDEYPKANGNQEYINSQNYKFMIYNIFIEFTRLFKDIGSVILLDNRNQANNFIISTQNKYAKLYPYDYDINYPYERIIHFLDRPLSFYINSYSKYAKIDSSLNCITPPNDQIALARKWIKKNIYPKIPIVITLRETKAASERNADILQWQTFVKTFSYHKEYLFIILRDYYELYSDDIIVGDNVVYCNEAVISVSFRASLYQESSLSLFVANGTAMLAWYNINCNYIMFMEVQKSACASLKSNKEKLSLDFDDNWHGATKYQKLVWQKDMAEVLIRETTDMLDILEKDNKLYPAFYDDNFQDKDKQEKDKKITYHNIYQEESIMSQRVPLKYYVWIFKLISLFKFVIFPSYKILKDIKLDKNTKILFYGAGTISAELIPKYKDNIIGIVDKNYLQFSNKKFEGIEVYSIEEIKKLTYDYIFISPINREYGIINELKEKFTIEDNKFLVLNKLR